MKNKEIIFFIGTTAELIKLFPIILRLRDANRSFKIIATGQNDISKSDIVRRLNISIDLELSKEDSFKKNAFGLFSWFGKTLLTSKKKIISSFDDVDFEDSIMVIHGDTISTVMGAIMAKRLHMRIAHVEAGLRSKKIFIPFPEEIDRRIIGHLADYSFAPSEWAAQNLSKYKGEIINTESNTIADALSISKNFDLQDKTLEEIFKKNYAVFVNHRQENMLNKKLVKEVVTQAIKVSEEKTVVFILHKITEDTLISMNLLTELQKCENIILLRRVEYFDFMKLLYNADFVITDGGSNQEELYYMGKPTLIIRNHTERQEGLGKNAVMFKGRLYMIKDFVALYRDYQQLPVIPVLSPSLVIADSLNLRLNNIQGGVK